MHFLFTWIKIWKKVINNPLAKLKRYSLLLLLNKYWMEEENRTYNKIKLIEFNFNRNCKLAAQKRAIKIDIEKLIATSATKPEFQISWVLSIKIIPFSNKKENNMEIRQIQCT